MDVTTAHLMPECYRGTSPRSASTPGPAPDSPASASGRFSASPLLSPCFPYYSAAHLHNASTLSLMGLNSHFLAPVLNPYALGLAAAAGLPAPLLHPGLTSPAAPAATKTPVSPPRALSFSVENILKPEFGASKPNPPEVSKSDSSATATARYSQPLKEPSSVSKALKRPAPPSSDAKKLKLSISEESKLPPATTAKETKQQPAASPVDLTKDVSAASKTSKTASDGEEQTELPSDPLKMVDPAKWPAWIFCTRYSDRPSSGPRTRRMKKDRKPEEKRPRTAFTSEQLARLKNEFNENRYLTEKRRQDLAQELNLHENQIKIWFQNKRAKIKKSSGQKNPLALQLMAQGLYNHSTVPVDEDEDEEAIHQEA